MKDFEVITVANIMSKLGLHVVADKKLSDHSVLTSEIEMYDVLSNSAQANVDLDSPQGSALVLTVMRPQSTQAL